MKSRDENRVLLDESVKRLMAYSLEKREEKYLKGLAMAMANRKNKQALDKVLPAQSVSK